MTTAQKTSFVWFDLFEIGLNLNSLVLSFYQKLILDFCRELKDCCIWGCLELN